MFLSALHEVLKKDYMTTEKSDIEKVESYYTRDHSEIDISVIANLFCDRDREKDLRQLLRRQWYELFQKEAIEDKNLDHVLHRIHYDLNTRNRGDNKYGVMIRAARWFSRVAAILIIPLAIYSAIQFFGKADNDASVWVEIKAPAWTRTQFSLPDGTKGWLNSNSSVRYKGDFTRNRNIELNGEAYLDVATDVKRPFIVEAGAIQVTVVGTKFNVASYGDEDVIEVVLEEGEIICSGAGMASAFTLKPNDYLTFNKNTRDFHLGVVEKEKYSSWKDGRLVFRNDPLDVVARRLERWYNIEVEVEGNIENKPVLRATFLDERLEEVLKLLKLSLSVNYRIEYPQIQADGIYTKTKVIITSQMN